jgi:hypothetical protein
MLTVSEVRLLLAALKKMGIPVQVPEAEGSEGAPNHVLAIANISHADDVRIRAETERWSAIKDATDWRRLEEHLRLFPDGIFSDLAREKWEEGRWFETGNGPQVSKAYQDFLCDFPNGRHSAEACKKLDKLASKEEEVEWHRLHGSGWKRLTGARSGVNREELGRFIKKYPKGAFWQRAEDLEKFLSREESAWERVKPSPDLIVVKQFLEAFPDGPHAAAANAQYARLKEQTPSVTEAPRSAWKVIGTIAVIGFLIGSVGSLLNETRILGYWVDLGHSMSWRIISLDDILRYALISIIIFKYGLRSVREFIYTYFLLYLSDTNRLHLY